MCGTAWVLTDEASCRCLCFHEGDDRCGEHQAKSLILIELAEEQGGIQVAAGKRKVCRAFAAAVERGAILHIFNRVRLAYC